jgi:hypothetical protein
MDMQSLKTFNHPKNSMATSSDNLKIMENISTLYNQQKTQHQINNSRSNEFNAVMPGSVLIKRTSQLRDSLQSMILKELNT